MLRKGAIAGAVLAGAMALPTAALAQSAFVTAELNLRLGPSPSYEVVTVIPADETVTLIGCLDAMNWCEVTFAGETGWVYADYISYEVEGAPIIIREAAARVDIPIVTYEGDVAVTTTGTIGPVETTIAAVTPPDPVRTFVIEEQVEPVFVEGEVVLGATLPEAVILHPVPDYEHRFAFVNQQRVLVDPGTRQVIYIVR
jgi:uncharacterized protein YraI